MAVICTALSLAIINFAKPGKKRLNCFIVQRRCRHQQKC